jgi:twitching motility protein PilT
MESIISIFDKVLAQGVEIQASDIHLCVGSNWKYRIHGHIVPITTLPRLKMSECELILKHIILQTRMTPIPEIDRTVETLQELDCSYTLSDISRFRVNVCRQRNSFSVVLRIIPFVSPTIESLGLPKITREIALEERGLVLVTGATGSGKSTTLAAMIDLINHTKPCKVVTIEDPIEYLHREDKASIVQREIGMDTESFAKALRGAMRQDPDVILVGEMRDRTTMDIALKAAETGHLVLSTLHTIDAPKTIQRMISVFDINDQKSVRLRLADSLKAVISQRLLRRADNKGRVVVVEVMRNTLTIKDCIENPEKTGNIRDHLLSGTDQYGMQTFDQHLMDLYSRGIIDLETAKAAATSPADFQRNVHMG